MMTADFLTQINEALTQGLTEFLDRANYEAGDLFVLGCSTSEIQGQRIGQDSNLAVGETVISTVLPLVQSHGLHLAVQGCEHLNRALVIERAVAKQLAYEPVTVYPSLKAGGATQVAAFKAFDDPIMVEHVQAQLGMDVGDTAIGMQVKFVQIPVRTSVTEVGHSHTTYLASRPKLIGGERAVYTWSADNYS